MLPRRLLHHNESQAAERTASACRCDAAARTTSRPGLRLQHPRCLAMAADSPHRAQLKRLFAACAGIAGTPMLGAGGYEGPSFSHRT